jgi:hypothetical protein
MLWNLKSEMKRHGVRRADIQRLIGCSSKTVDNKIAGTNAFSIGDAFKIRDTFFPSLRLEYLFTDEETKDS